MMRFPLRAIPLGVPGLRAVLAGAVLGAVLALATNVQAQTGSADDLLSAVVKVKTFINPDARTTGNLGRERTGSGVVIDHKGLIVTIGYLMVEAYAAEITTDGGQIVPANIVGYDHETGFGLLQAITPLRVQPMPLGTAASVKAGDQVIAAGYGKAAGAVSIVAKREFAGNWEYLLDEAIFTAPPHPLWSGAALVGRDGKLVGIGSLIVGDADGGGGRPGNMFVPIDLLPPILGDLIADGRSNGPATPWLGVTTQDVLGRLVVSRVTEGGPAAKAGLQRGEVVSGVGGQPVRDLADLYRKIRALGAAGVGVPLDVEAAGQSRRVDVTSANRLDHLKLKSTF